MVLTACALGYVTSFLVAYHVSVVPRYEYFGMGTRDLPWWAMGCLLVAGASPGLVAPMRLQRPSVLLYWTMYLLVYVPSLFLLFFSRLPRLEIGHASTVAAALWASFMILALAYKIHPRSFRLARLAPRALSIVLAALALGLYALVIGRFGGLARFVSIMDVGGQRELFLATATGSIAAYAYAWVVAVVNPVLVAIGTIRRRRGLIVMGLAGQAMMYGIAASKGVLLSLIVLPALIFLVNRFRDRFAQVMVGGLAVAVLIAPIADIAGATLVGSGASFVLLFRSLAVPGLATAQYAGFFQEHPLTLGSHVSGLSRLVDYPYPVSLDYLLGQYYYGQVNMGLNASAWAGDGLAGVGPAGLPVVALLCASLFWVIDSAAEGLDARFTSVVLGYAIVNFSNVSLFTNLVTGGMALVILLLVLWPRRGPEALSA